MASLLEAIRRALAEAERDYALNTGRGKGGSKEGYDRRVGHAQGLASAMEIVNETAKKVIKEED